MPVVALVAGLLLAALPVPPLTGPVVDRAGVIDASDEARLDALARAARATNGGKGPQLAFLTVQSLEGEPIEMFSIRVAEAWKLGGAAEDNGVLFVVAVNDRQMRIEVGNGIEGELTDAQSGRIIREIVVPAFGAGQYGQGLYAGASRALAALGVQGEGIPRAEANQHRRNSIDPLFVILFLLPLVFLRLMGGRRRRTFWMGPGGFGGGGFGGGGGYRGGGGGFSGGGASGRW